MSITPGPWRVERGPEFDTVLAPNGGRVVALVGRSAADAPAIAALPDLLAALESAVEQYGKPGGPWSVPDDPGGWLALARAALKKARGET